MALPLIISRNNKRINRHFDDYANKTFFGNTQIFHLLRSIYSECKAFLHTYLSLILITTAYNVLQLLQNYYTNIATTFDFGDTATFF